MDNKLITICITLVVGVILAGSVLMPVLENTTTTEKTFDNTPYAFYQMKALEEDDIWTKDGTTWTANGEVLTNASSNDVSIVATNNMVIRQSGQIRGETYISNVTGSAEVIVIDESDYLKINTSDNVAYTEGYGAVVEGGDLILKNYTDAIYVHGDTKLWGTGINALSTGSSSSFVMHVEGSIDDGFTVTVVNVRNSTNTGLTAGECTVNYEAVEGYNDLYKISNVSFDVSGTFNDEELTKAITFSTFVAPKEVTAELSQHMTSGEIALLNAIPILVIISLVMVAVGGLYFGRRD